MSHVGRDLSILLVILALGAVSAMAAASNFVAPPETALTLTSTGPDGTTDEVVLEEGELVILQSIDMKDLAGQGIDLSDHQVGENTLSVAQGAGFCLVVSRPSVSEAMEQTVTIDPAGFTHVQYIIAPDSCLECTFYSGVNLNLQTFECTVPEGNGCGHCLVVPCLGMELYEGNPPAWHPDNSSEIGWNSPVIDGAKIGGTVFHELSLSGTAGLRLTTPSVLIAAARAQREQGGSRDAAAALIGKSADVIDAAGDRYRIRIAGIAGTRFWAGAKAPVTTYIMTVSSEADPTPRPLCTGARNEAILFTGDRYDAATKSVSATGAAAEGWINVACDGTAPAKLYLTRHTDASQQLATTRSDRQAMLKMMTDDVYGDGVSFTVPGQPLLWSDAKGITTFSTTAHSVEGLWNEHGAVCLNEPRRPETAQAIEEHGTRPPRCTDEMLKTPGLGYVMSANPKIPR